MKISLPVFKRIILVSCFRLSLFDFFKQAMEKLRIPIKILVGVGIPEENQGEFLQTLFLDNDLFSNEVREEKLIFLPSE